ncbi:Asp23/Gls24 family envelope stress response protein [Deinococcus cellulosilyticus]|uniref:Alkaline-shock protein n=1 Tax=Deinococcus cellulosilyticus (strain DSM 18568 / NBRC 106333 / KACC 11606 / 5516J-15) TaxID=1223518 RepID=A0A511N0T1_DEIC1|nr:Asp23/Gls24 family envelope stress response protein [Deinococcus cellulosilyticus]GEM46067.1 alkaline-shock protein [Deinococcus cellulosilyticus NBRC 106333 = KACC 11606]
MLNISKDVIIGIAGFTLQNVSGVKSPTKTIKVDREQDQVSLDLGLTISYGANLLKLCSEVQRSVAENIELMTGLKVRAVNVTVQSVVE